MGGGKGGTGGGKGGSAGSISGGRSGAGTTGNGGEAGGGGGCDITKSPADETCLVSDEFAVFVSPDGDDGNDGSQNAPFATLTKAVEAAAGTELVLVCSATYDEHVSITTGARVYGGFTCADWSADTGKPLFKPTTAGTALSIEAVANDLLIEGVSFEVGDAVAAGATAMTAIVNASPKVTLRAVSLTSGEGMAGANGALASFTFASASSLNGNAENPAGSGGGEKACACQGTLMSIGGVGGVPSSAGTAGSKGLPDHGAGQPGSPGSCVPGGGGSDGNNAPAAGAASGAAQLGTAASSSWEPSPGTDGATGQPGQGGGGGASRNSLGHGGGGGCGGCGGNGGSAGKGGGASIALLAIDSPVVFEASTLTSADAGNGGSGVAGQAGQQSVGSGGDAIASANSCDGGTGGKGGNGGAGGGGAGGISVGVLWKGVAAPTVSADTTITNGVAGVKGIGGVPSTNDGVAGVAQKILPLN